MVTPVLLDTTILIDHLRNNIHARQALIDARKDNRRITASVLTRTEVLGGMRSSEKARTFALFQTIDWIPVDEITANEAGILARRYRKSHSGIDIADYVIAATTISTRADLWTINIKHFPMFSNLAPPY